jgi:hypothetical protein
MLKRIEPIRVISFLLLVACEALCQSERPALDLLPEDGSTSPEAQSPEMRTWRSLPDAPSAVQPPKPAEKFQAFVDEAHTPLTFGAADINSVRRGTELRHVTPGPQLTFSAPYEAAFTQEGNVVDRYLNPSSLNQNLLYHPSTSSSFMGRATDSASRILITRDDSGKKRLNTSFLLGVLSSVAIHSAYHPYYARSPSAPFNDVGSTIGNGAGMNLFHEFGPGIRQMVKDHAPKFASRLGERITHDQKLRESVSSSAR